MAEKEVGFTSMAAKTKAGNIPEVGIGMLGYAFMGKAHSNALKTLPYMMYPPPMIPDLVAITQDASGRASARALAAIRSKACSSPSNPNTVGLS